tara:strand:- start:3162 stop:3965 length:804 start_codon:yes stop_codon:yes gene_type:complete
MSLKKNNQLASVIIVNYNNSNRISKCINSIKDQKYKFIETIFVDDQSEDGSLKTIKKFNNIKIIKTRFKTTFGSFNQINAYYEGFLKTKGDVIFFLDSDDYFFKNKIKDIMKLYSENKKLNVLFDLPVYLINKKKIKKKFKQKSFIFSSWPRFSPQSCISLRRSYANKIFKISKIKKYPNIWLDFRIATYMFQKYKKLDIIKNYLTYYRVTDNSASSKFKTFNEDWWLRRNEAHEYFKYIANKLNIKDRLTVDKIITKIINMLIKKK